MLNFSLKYKLINDKKLKVRTNNRTNWESYLFHREKVSEGRERKKKSERNIMPYLRVLNICSDMDTTTSLKHMCFLDVTYFT